MVPPSARFPTRRAALAEEAARRALAGLGPELVLPQLRAQTVQELLAQPGGAGCELCGTLQTLTGALTQCVRRRPGWLYVMFPSGITCPVPARPALVQAAVLEALRPVLACGGQAVLEVKPRSRAVLLCLRGGAPAGVLPLWQALARQELEAFDSWPLVTRLKDLGLTIRERKMADGGRLIIAVDDLVLFSGHVDGFQYRECFAVRLGPNGERAGRDGDINALEWYKRWYSTGAGIENYIAEDIQRAAREAKKK